MAADGEGTTAVTDDGSVEEPVERSGAEPPARMAADVSADAIRVIPAAVTLRANEQQKFVALVKGDSKNEVEWLIAPETGSLGERPSLRAPAVYKAPPSPLRDDLKVVVTAISRTTGTTGSATVTLLADPWIGWGPHRIGIWLLALASIVYVFYGRWPPPGDRLKVAAALAASQEADRVVQQRQHEYTTLVEQLDGWKGKQRDVQNASLQQGVQSQIDKSETSLTAANTALKEAQRAKQSKDDALAAERQARDENVLDERHMFLLVLFAGALGSFVHTTKSYVNFVGNKRIGHSWTWWYILQPFTGAALAMVMYLVVRGGFFATATGATAINPWGIVAVSALVGLFSKQATDKLDELFTTMFRTDKDRELKDKLRASTETSGSMTK